MSDKTSSGTLNAEELNKLILQLSNINFPEQTHLFLKIFEIIDEDYSGSVSVKEIYRFLLAIGFEIDFNNSDIMKKSMGERIDFCTFLSIFEFKNENLLQFQFEYDELEFKPVNTEENKNKVDKVKLKNKVNEVINIEDVRRKHKEENSNLSITSK
mmetsp:Transcript_31657/g.26673  ORF Transcript_31657/g.26673 Transcript_31657/m.26673 type:complete len:156 (+) Transcript_31657:659-1126(+)